MVCHRDVGSTLSGGSRGGGTWGSVCASPAGDAVTEAGDRGQLRKEPPVENGCECGVSSWGQLFECSPGMVAVKTHGTCKGLQLSEGRQLGVWVEKVKELSRNIYYIYFIYYI